MAPVIIVVGAGLVGSLTASNIMKYLQNFTVKVWDKALGPGGRLSTSRSPTNNLCTADIGAQYFSVSDEYLFRNKQLINPLMTDKILEPLDAKIEGLIHTTKSLKLFVAPHGTSSIINYLLEPFPKRDVEYSKKVVSIDEKNDRFLLQTEAGDECLADGVVLTMPVPQLLEIKGSVQELIRANKLLPKVKYSSRFVIVWFYDKNITLPNVDWACKYMDHEVFRFVSIDNHKRNRKDLPTAVVFHTNVKFGSEYVNKHLSEVENILSKSAKELFPDWPSPSSVKYHKWRYSQVIEPYSGGGCITLKYMPTLVIGGDGFTESNLEGCCLAAKYITDTMIALRRNSMNDF